jgi:hypothetical protein
MFIFGQPGIDQACKRLGLGDALANDYAWFSVDRTVIYGLQHAENTNK